MTQRARYSHAGRVFFPQLNTPGIMPGASLAKLFAESVLLVRIPFTA
jgi:hypothetical protein